jgi:hypothetical protein
MSEAEMMEKEAAQEEHSRLLAWVRRRPNLSAALLLLLLALLFMGFTLWPSGGQILGGHDMRGYYFPYYELVREAVRSGRLPFWEPTLFNGYPFMAQPQQNAFYPPLWPGFILPLNTGISLYMLLHIWLAGMGMFLLVRYLNSRWLPAILSAIAFAFSGLLAGRLWAGHSTVYALVAWTPWIILGLFWSVRRSTIWTAIIAGLPVGLSLLAGHIPSFLYVGMIWGLFVLYLLITENGRRPLVLRQALIMLLAGLALAAVQLAPFLQFSLASERLAEADYAFATDYSLPPAHLITLLVPEFFGEPTRVGYWSVPTFEELAYYAGLLAILGIVLALKKPSKLTWFLIVVMVFGMALALGRYGILYPLAYKYLPPFRIVRAPGRATTLFLFSATLLLGLSFSAWLDMPLAQRREKLGPLWRWTLAIIAVLGVTALVATGAVFMAVHPTDTSGRLWQQIGGYALATIILLLGGGLIWAYLMTPRNRERRRALFAIALIALTVTDMWLFAYKFVRLEPPTPDAFWVDAQAVIGETTERVLPWGVSLFDQNGAMQVGLHSVFGYDSLEPAEHIALASSVPDPRSTAYDILAARYVIAPTELNDFDDGERPLSLLGHHGAAWVYERARPLPVARLVYDVEIIPDGGTAVQRVHEPDFDPATTAILTADPSCELGPIPESQGTAEILESLPGHWSIATESSSPALLVLAETAYPGWQVQIDGETAEALTAYTTLKAICVPAGSHEVSWNYVPTVYWVGGIFTIAALVLVLAAIYFLLKGNASDGVHNTPAIAPDPRAG